jgi:hypothetical protein
MSCQTNCQNIVRRVWFWESRYILAAKTDALSFEDTCRMRTREVPPVAVASSCGENMPIRGFNSSRTSIYFLLFDDGNKDVARNVKIFAVEEMNDFEEPEELFRRELNAKLKVM